MKSLAEIFHEFSQAFSGNIRGNGDIAHPSSLNRLELDKSLESLKFVDEYLNQIQALHDRLDQSEINNTILWGGAYVGEVIRNNAKRKLEWIDYNDYVPKHPELRPVLGERSLSTCAFLCDHEVMTMPINKVARFIYEGNENSVAYYAAGECNR